MKKITEKEFDAKLEKIKKASSNTYIDKLKDLSLKSMHTVPNAAVSMPVQVYCDFFDDYFDIEEGLTMKQAQLLSKAMCVLYKRYEQAFPSFVEGMKKKKLEGYYRLKG